MNRCAVFLLISVLSVSGFQNGGAQAASPGDELVLEEIIVTATKREASLQDLPLSVGVMTEQQLRETGALSMEDYARMVPSLNLKNAPNGGNSVIIRGLSDSDSFQSNESLNSFYIDDTAITHVPGLFTTPGDPALVDVARIEVLRGPQGTIVGANAMGGAIRVISNEPDPENSERELNMNLSSTAHGDMNYGGTFILNQPSSEGNSALRLAVFYQDDEGFIDDIGLERDNINSEERKGARLSWLWDVSDTFQVMARIYTEETGLGGYNYSDPVGKPALGLLTDGDYQAVLLTPEPREEELQIASVRLKWQTGWGEVYSATSWYEQDIGLNFDWSHEFHFNFGFYQVSPFYTELVQEDLSQELRFSSDSDGPVNWIAGLYYLDQDSTRFDTGAAPGLHEACPGCFPFIAPDEILLVFHEQSSRKDTSVFGEVTWQIGDQFETTLGGRWYRIERDTATQGFFAFNPLDDVVSGEGDDFVSKVSLSWDLSEQTMIYGLYSEGFRSGQFNNAASRQVCGARSIIDSDKLQNFEIGVRTQLAANRVSLNATAFHIDWDDIQTSVFRPDCPFVFLENAGRATSDGFELDITAVLSESFELQGGFGYNRAELAEASPAFNAPKGTPIPNVPKVTANLAGTWNFSWNDRIDGFFRGDVQYVDSHTTNFDPTFPEQFPTPAELDEYTLVNIRLGGETGRWRSEIFVDNLFDEVADLFCCRLLNETYINRPRTIGIRSRFNF